LLQNLHEPENNEVALDQVVIKQSPRASSELIEKQQPKREKGHKKPSL
jgi:hypothetical protein